MTDKRTKMYIELELVGSLSTFERLEHSSCWSGHLVAHL